MRTSRIFRWAALAAVLGAFAPAPASAQLGRFIKKKLKQTIAQAVVETVAPADTAPAGATGWAQALAPARAVMADAEAVPRSGPAFNESVLEMTTAVLVKFEKGLVAEAAARNAASQLARTDRQQFADMQAQAIQKASGLTPRQYAILKERVLPFCTVGVSTVGHSVPHVTQGGAFLVYSMQELMALGPWCPKLSLSLKALA